MLTDVHIFLFIFVYAALWLLTLLWIATNALEVALELLVVEVSKALEVLLVVEAASCKCWC